MKRISVLLLILATAFSLLTPTLLVSQEKKEEAKLKKYLKILERDPSNDYLFEKTWSIYRKTSLSSLAKRYEEKVQTQPANFKLRILAARLYLQENEKKPALKHLKEAAKIIPSSPLPPYFMGKIYQVQGKKEKAIEAFEKVWPKWKQTQKRQDLLIALGELYKQTGQEKKAVERWMEILRPRPTPGRIQTVIRTLIKFDFFEEAEALLTKNIPRTRNIREKMRLINTLAQVQLYQGKRKEALKNYEKILNKTTAGHWIRETALSQKRKIYFQQGRARELLQFYKKRAAKSHSFEDYREMIVIAHRILESEGAAAFTPADYVEWIKKARKHHPQAPFFFRKLARFYRGRGEVKKEISLYKKWLEKHPRQDSAWVQLGKLYGKEKSTEKASRAWAKLSEIDSSHHSYLKRAKLHLSIEDKKGALQVLEKGHKKHPRHVKFNLQAARLLMDMKEKDRAQKILKKLAANRDPKMSPLTLSRLYSRYGFYKEALKLLQALSKEGDQTLWNMAKIQKKRKKRQAAIDLTIKAFEQAKKEKRKNFYLEKIAELAHTSALAKRTLAKIKRLKVQDSLKAPFFYLQGLLAERSGEDDEALKLYKESLSLSPKYADPRKRLAQLYSFSKPKKAIVEYEKLLKIDPQKKSRYLLNLAHLYSSQKMKNKKRECFEKLASLPHLPKDMYLEIASFYKTREADKALQILKKGHVQYPNHKLILEELVKVCRQRAPQDAIPFLFKWRDLAGTQKEKSKVNHLLYSTYLSLGTRALEKGKTSHLAQGRKFFREAKLYANTGETTVIQFHILRSYLAQKSRSKKESKEVIRLYESLTKKGDSTVQLDSGHTLQISLVCRALASKLNALEKKNLTLPEDKPLPGGGSREKGLANLPLYRAGELALTMSVGNYYNFSEPLVYNNQLYLVNTRELKVEKVDIDKEKRHLLYSKKKKKKKKGRSSLSHRTRRLSYYAHNLIRDFRRYLVVGDTLYMGSSPLVAINLKTWKLQWSYNIPKLSVFMPQFVLGDNLIVVELFSQNIYCMDRKLGKIRWVRKEKGSASRGHRTRYSSVYTALRKLPLVMGEGKSVFVLRRRSLEKWQVLTGQVEWSQSLSQEAKLTLGRAQEGRYIAVPHQTHFSIWDHKKGQKLYEISLLPKDYSSRRAYKALRSFGIYQGKLIYLRYLRYKKTKFQLICHDLKTNRTLWKRTLPDSYTNSYTYGKFFLTFAGKHIYLSHRMISAFQLSDGKLVMEDPIRKVILSHQSSYNQNLGRPQFMKDRLVYCDYRGNLFVHENKPLSGSLASPPSKLSWKELYLGRPSSALGLTKVDDGIALRFRIGGKKEKKNLTAVLAKSSPFARAWKEIKEVCQKENKPLDRLVFSLNSSLPGGNEIFSIWQPYFYQKRGLMGIKTWKLSSGPVIYLTPKALKKIMKGKIVESGLLKELGKAFLQHVHGLFHASQLSMDKLGDMISGPSRNKYYQKYTSSPFYAFSEAFGQYLEWSYSYPEKHKKSISKFASAQRLGASYYNFRNRPQSQALILLTLEKGLHFKDGRRECFQVILNKRSQRMGAFLADFVELHPSKKIQLSKIVRKMLGSSRPLKGGYTFNQVLQDFDRGIGRLDRILGKGFERSLQGMERDLNQALRRARKLFGGR